MVNRRRIASAFLLVVVCAAALSVHASETVSYPFFGITHTDRTDSVPRPLRIHVITIDLNNPHVGFLMTPQSGPRDTLIQTTRQFLVARSAQLAVNAHFFTPFPDDGSGTTWLISLAASSATNGPEGHAYAPFERNLGGAFQNDLPAVNIDANNVATLVYQAAGDVTGYATDPPVVLYNAVSGNEQLLRDGIIVSGTTSFDTTLNPRTAIGLAPGNKLVLLTVDGRQSGVSEGVTTAELAGLLHEDYGVTDAINLDGGGSTTLVMADPVARVVNVPVGVNNVPNSERSVGSSLAVFSLACSAQTEGMRCGDSDFCNGVETCVGGTCRPGPPPDCDDANPCTDDACVPATGCRHVNNTASCSDGRSCNGIEVCGGGLCQPGVPINCDDGISCTADSCNEATGTCDHAPCAVGVAAEGSRYLAVTPPAGLASVALRVSSTTLACLPKYVDTAGRLSVAPVFRSSAQWGTVHVADRAIVPATSYTVTAEAAGGGAIAAASTTTARWGNADGQDDVTVFDIVCVLDGSQNLFTHCDRHADDQNPGIPDGVIDGDDVLATLHAFSGTAYPDADPCAMDGVLRP